MKYLIVAILALMMTGCQLSHGVASSASMPEYCLLRTVSAPSKVVRVDVFLEANLHHGAYLVHPACPEFLIRIANRGAGVDGSAGEFLDEVLRQASGGYVKYRIDALGVYVVNSTGGKKRRRFRLIDVVSYQLVEGGGGIKPIRPQTNKGD